jgi:hypothetical protein
MPAGVEQARDPPQNLGKESKVKIGKELIYQIFMLNI